MAIVRKEGNYCFLTLTFNPATWEVEDIAESNVDVKSTIAAKALDVVWRQASE